MKTRFMIRWLTFLSWLPLAACATSDMDGDVPGSVGGGSQEAAANDANLNKSIGSSLGVDDEDIGLDNNADYNDNNDNNETGNKNNMNLLGDEEGGDSDFDDNGDVANSNPEANPGPAADAGSGIDDFENSVAGEDFTADTSAGSGNPATAGTNGAVDAFKNTAIEPNASSAAGEAPTENLAENLAAPTPPAAAAPVPAQPAVHDVEATPSILYWVGYKINENLKRLDLEIVTKGRPEYEIFQQDNRMQQSELIIRFYRSVLRPKLHWDINSSEFRSPVAYIRMKDKKAEGYVDLVITHRDRVEPLFYEKNGNFLLSYTIPERYFGGQALKAKALKDKAISLSGEKPLARVKTEASKLPTVGFPRYTAQFSETPKLLPIRNFISRSKGIRSGKDGLPESFNKEIIGKRTGEILSRRTLLGVAQDDVENDFEDEASTENFTGDDVNSNLGNTNGAGVGNSASGENGSATNDLSGGFDSTSNPDAFSDLNDTPEPKGQGKSAANGAPAQSEGPMENLSAPLDTAPVPAAVDAPMMKTNEAQEVEPQDPTGRKTQYTGKPIFMEFYDSPLSLVLKGFSEETGNNFVFPTEVGATQVTVHFKGVPWDEALKAILETYSLGMVRIGENVVRVDKITALTGYMQAMEAAKQFESRRIATKVMVFRLNNAVSKDVKEKLTALLARDIEIDTRIKISDDDRTNIIVIEAPENTLAKARAIIERLDLETPQVEITSRIVEVQKFQNSFLGVGWGNNLNFDPGRALGFGTLNFPNSVSSSFSVDPGVASAAGINGNAAFRLGSLNKFINLDLLLKLEEKKGTTNVLQSNRVLVLDGQKASVLAGSSQFFRPAAGGNVINPAAGTAVGSTGLSEITFDLSLEVTPQVTALGNVIMNLLISSDTPGDPTGEQLASKSTRRLNTQMVRASGETGVIGGIYDTKRVSSVSGIPFLSDLPIIGALFRSTTTKENQTELLIMVTPTIMSGPGDKNAPTAAAAPPGKATILSQKQSSNKGSL